MPCKFADAHMCHRRWVDRETMQNVNVDGTTTLSAIAASQQSDGALPS
ncbi:MAG: hypothetical protein HOP32_08580 [Nitrospira sp.]|nr:hypothetical protein [Nitrospira sp.]